MLKHEIRNHHQTRPARARLQQIHPNRLPLFQSEVHRLPKRLTVNGKASYKTDDAGRRQGTVMSWKQTAQTEAAAMQALTDLINNYFGEGE